MSKNLWLLPNGIDELVEADARVLETLRRELLDVFDSWGYDLAFPPIIEFTDALLTGLGESLDLQTFKFSDHQSGKSLGLRADISPQIARIDAHRMKYEGANRLCYAGTIVRANPDGSSMNRAPVQVGAELFGIKEIEGDFEIISLMLATMATATDQDITLEVSHQALKQWLKVLAANAGLDFELLCSLISDKRLPELDDYLQQAEIDSSSARKLCELPRLMGDSTLLDTARKVFSSDAQVLLALDEMEKLAARIGNQFPEVDLLFNLGEIQGTDYHTGLVFAAYTELDNRAIRIANGGRYDKVGEAFGRSRAATGFSADLKVLAQLMDANISESNSVYAEIPSAGEVSEGVSRTFWERVEGLRQQGYRVKLGYPSEREHLSEYKVEKQLVEKDGDWQLVDF